MTLPVNVDATYADTGDPSRKLHQQHHDTIHAFVNDATTIGVRAWRSGLLAVPTATLTVIPLTDESFDDDGFHDPATNPSRLTVPTGRDGLYRIAGQVFYAAGAGPVGANLRLNGATFLAEALGYGQAGSSTSIPVDTVERLAAGDYVELTAYQTSGGSLDVAGTDRSITFLTMTRIGA